MRLLLHHLTYSCVFTLFTGFLLTAVVHVPWQHSSTSRCDREVSSCTLAADEHAYPAAPPSGTTSLREKTESLNETQSSPLRHLTILNQAFVAGETKLLSGPVC